MTEATLNKPSKMKLAYSSLDDMKFTPGRRAWIRYRDLGVQAATNGAMRAEIMHIDDVLEFSPDRLALSHRRHAVPDGDAGLGEDRVPDTGVITIKKGESIMIPGGVVHQELCSSEPFRLLEISTPATMNTVPVEAPAGACEHASAYGEVEPALTV